MWIFCEKNGKLINTDKVFSIYTTQDKKSIGAKSAEGETETLCRFETEEQTKAALVDFWSSIRAGIDFFTFREKITTPEEENPTQKEHWHHATGKKTKGHGGS